jgi:hypothetical protein
MAQRDRVGCKRIDNDKKIGDCVWLGKIKQQSVSARTLVLSVGLLAQARTAAAARLVTMEAPLACQHGATPRHSPGHADTGGSTDCTGLAGGCSGVARSRERVASEGHGILWTARKLIHSGLADWIGHEIRRAVHEPLDKVGRDAIELQAVIQRSAPNGRWQRYRPGQRASSGKRSRRRSEKIKGS